MTGNIEELTLHTNLGVVKGDSIYLKNIHPHIRHTILKNQARVADLEKKLYRFVAFVDEKDRISPEDDILTEIINYINNVFGDFVKK